MIISFIFEQIPAEVKNKFPPVDAYYGEEFYPVLNLSLASPLKAINVESEKHQMFLVLYVHISLLK